MLHKPTIFMETHTFFHRNDKNNPDIVAEDRTYVFRESSSEIQFLAENKMQRWLNKRFFSETIR